VFLLFASTGGAAAGNSSLLVVFTTTLNDAFFNTKTHDSRNVLAALVELVSVHF